MSLDTRDPDDVRVHSEFASHCSSTFRLWSVAGHDCDDVTTATPQLGKHSDCQIRRLLPRETPEEADDDSIVGNTMQLAYSASRLNNGGTRPELDAVSNFHELALLDADPACMLVFFSRCDDDSIGSSGQRPLDHSVSSTSKRTQFGVHGIPRVGRIHYATSNADADYARQCAPFAAVAVQYVEVPEAPHCPAQLCHGSNIIEAWLSVHLDRIRGVAVLDSSLQSFLKAVVHAASRIEQKDSVTEPRHTLSDIEYMLAESRCTGFGHEPNTE